MFDTPPTAALASAILTLINSRPRTPTHAEIEGVLSRALGPAAPASPLTCELRRLRAEHHRLVWAELDADEQHGMRSPEFATAAASTARVQAEMDILSERAWSAPIASLHDLMPIIEVALTDVERAPNGSLLGTPASDSPHHCCPYQRAQMRLLLAVAQLTGCAVAQDGVMGPLNEGSPGTVQGFDDGGGQHA